MNFLKFLAFEALGYVLIIYAKWIVDNTQRMDFAEKWFGPTGTYTLYKLIGAGLMAYGFYVLMN